MSLLRLGLLFLCTLALSACHDGSSRTRTNNVTPPNPTNPSVERQLTDDPAVQCVVNDQRRSVGSELDAPGKLEVVVNTPLGSPAQCANNQDYLVGTGLHDITAPIADTASLAWVNPQQVFSGLHSRVYARAFAMASPCNDKRVMFVSIDTGLMSASIRQDVLAEIAANEELSTLYNANNVMLSVTHTHSDPGEGLAGVGNGHAVIVGGIVGAITRAQANLAANPEPARIALSSGELLNTNINRSKPAYAKNTEAERKLFLNSRNEETQVNKRMVQLELTRTGGNAAGLINWFGVHPTVIGPNQHFVSGDVKGYASLGFERLMGTNYGADPAQGTFVSAFAQADEGDASPNIAIEEFPYPSPQRGGGANDFDANAISGIKQLARAIELYRKGTAVTGPVDYQFLRIPITDVTVEDPAVIASLKHPAELDEEVKRTCDGILGTSFGAGAEDGPGPTQEGLKCSDDPAVLEAAQTDIASLSGSRLGGFPGSWPENSIPGQFLSAAVMCNAQDLPPILGDFSCQAEKPLLLPRGGSVLPFQLFRVGNFALLGLPWEVTTMSARRIRSLLLEELAPVGIDTIVIAGLVNDYVHYLTTREEYSSQQYEGASTLYGPWTQAAVAQESLKMARAMHENVAPAAPAAPGARPDLTLFAGPQESPHPSGSPGTVVTQPPSSISAGQVLDAEFVVGHPGNDLRIQESYVYIEKELPSGEWEVIEEDRTPELLYEWLPITQAPVAQERPQFSSGGTGLVNWTIPPNTPTGTYRIRVVGASRGLTSAEAQPYEAISNTFNIITTDSTCP
ncbi:MAG: neutral ceramidase [Bermanella sp.]|jgi:neutral ceramidase